MTAAILTPRARRELRDAMQWIAKDNPGAARALRRAIVQAASQLGAHPESGTRRPEIVESPYRFWMVRGYPYIIVYNAERRPPSIVRIVHGARDLPVVLSDL